ncbi:hypothetical protein IGI04_031063, partial [Brassica rapa subsp. trilocularis]
AVYGTLNKWLAWEVEFSLLLQLRLLQILRKRSQSHRVIQMVLIGQKTPVAKWMLSKGHTRSISRRLFARMIALYAHHDLQDKVI